MRRTSKKLYSQIHGFLPTSFRGKLTKFLYDFGIKPTVNRKVKSPFKKGAVVFSADFELSWAWRYSKSIKKYLEKGQLERNNVPKILELLDHYDIPVTWATVGHLFLHECKKENNELPHPDMIRPHYFSNKYWRFEIGDWYDHDPCLDLDNAPEWYGADLIEKILQSKVKHEIGCHTFSHIDLSDKNCSIELADSEIKKCIQVAQKFNVKLESMVFPGNIYGNFKALKENGFICYRKPAQFDIDLPIKDKYGLIVIPDSSNLDKDPYAWNKDFHIQVAKRHVGYAIKYKLVCHLWFHPSMDEWYLDNVFPYILEYISEQAKIGKIEVLTMKDLAYLMLKS